MKERVKIQVEFKFTSQKILYKNESGEMRPKLEKERRSRGRYLTTMRT